MSRANQSFLRNDWSQIERVFYMTAPAPCPYLPHRTERKLITALDFGDDESFDQLSWSGFRRSHEIAYRPACPSCNACKSARIDVARHRPSRTQAKIMRRNADLSRSVQPARCSTEHWTLFDGYIRNRHGDSEMALMTPDDLRMMIEQPFSVAARSGQYDVICTVAGGGLSGQAGAVRHGISRALVNFEPDLRATLKPHSFLTRDPRAVERKKYGRAKARRSFQFSKR